MPRHVLAAAVLASSLLSCAGPATLALDAPPALATFPVAYEARVASPGVTEPAGLEVHDPLSEPTPEVGSGALLEVTCELVAMDAETAGALFGRSPTDAVAWTADRERVREALVAAALERKIESLTAPRLNLWDGQWGTLAVSNQTAYISHFDLQVADGQANVDPVVRVATDGIQLDLQAATVPDEDAVSVDVVLELADLQRPIGVVKTSVPGSTVPVWFQQPVLLTQKLSTSAPVRPGECLVLTAFAGEEPERRLIAILTARRLESDEASDMRLADAQQRPGSLHP